MKSTSRHRAPQSATDTRDSRINPLEPPSALETSQSAGARHSKTRRTATVYDAVAGRVGLNGFLTDSQLSSTQVRPLRPEEVLLRRVNAPERIPVGYYDADERLKEVGLGLPEGELLGDVHGYVADYYEAKNIDGDYGRGRHGIDFKSFDETALIAMGVLLEEACKECLGEDGDMVFSEPAGWDTWGPPRDVKEGRQVLGRVVPKEVQEYRSSTEEESGEDEVDAMQSRPRKRQRRRYGNVDEG